MNVCTPQNGLGWFLGAISAQDATNQIFPSSKITNTPGQTQAVWNDMEQSASDGQIVSGLADAYIPGTSQCAKANTTGAPSGTVKLVQLSTGLALQGINVAAVAIASVGAAIGTALGPLTFGISTVIGLLPLLFAHHSAAVAKEQTVLCGAVPAANNYLSIITQGVQSGQVTPQQAISALQSLESDFLSEVSSIIKGSISTSDCNAACVMLGCLQTIVVYLSSQYQDMIDAAATPAASATGATNIVAAATGTTPQLAPTVVASSEDWLPIAAILAAGFFLTRSL